MKRLHIYLLLACLVCVMSCTKEEALPEHPENASVYFAQESHPTAEGRGNSTIIIKVSSAPGKGHSYVIPIVAASSSTADSDDYTVVDPAGVVSGAVLTHVTISGNEQTSGKFEIQITDDEEVEDEETLVLEFGELPAALTAQAPTSSTLTIEASGAPFNSAAFAAATYTVTEGSTVDVAISIEVALNADINIPITVESTSTAASGTDYTALPAHITISSGSTYGTLRLSATTDTNEEAGGETVVLSMGNLPPGLAQGNPSTTTITIQDPVSSGLIPVRYLEQLYAMRYDLNGDGVVDPEFDGTTDPVKEAAYTAAFPDLVATNTYTGYKLMRRLNFDEDGSYSDPTTNKPKWSEEAGASSGWEPIGGVVDPFTSTFDGQHYTIDSLYISGTNRLALFGVVEGGTISNLGLIKPRIIGTEHIIGSLIARATDGSIDSCYVSEGYVEGTSGGGLVGSAGLTGAETNVSNCYVYETTVNGGGSTGGLAGDLRGTINKCYVYETTVSGNNVVGGLVGYLSSGNVSACYASGGSVRGSSKVGGLVGAIAPRASVHVRACYVNGTLVSGSDSGSLVGENASGSISACYTWGRNYANLVGDKDRSARAINSYFQADVTRTSDDTNGGRGYSASDLQSPTTYTGIYAAWNIDVDNGLSAGVDDATAAGDAAADDVWDFGSTSDYPKLKVDFNRDGTATVAEFGNQSSGSSSSVITFAKESYIVAESDAIDITVNISSAPSADINIPIRIKSSSTATSGTDYRALPAHISIDAGETSGTMSVSTQSDSHTEAGGETLVLSLGSLPSGLAKGTFASSTVSIHDPIPGGLIPIRYLEQLNAIRYDLNGDGKTDPLRGKTNPVKEAAYKAAFPGLVSTYTYTGYKLERNLDFNENSSYIDAATNKPTWTTGEGFVPIGARFSSLRTTFDGQGHTISNLYIDRSSHEAIDMGGLFISIGSVTGKAVGTVRNLGLVDPRVTAVGFVAALAAMNMRNSNIVACYVQGGSIRATWGFSRSLGSLVENNRGTITACYVKGTSLTGVDMVVGGVGGLVSDNSSGLIRASYAIGISVVGISSYGSLVSENSGTIKACYAVDANNKPLSEDGGTIINSYYQAATSSGNGKTESELKTPTTYGTTATDIYKDWNIDVDAGLEVGVQDATAAGDAAADDVWDFGTTSTYPKLKVDFNGDGTATVAEFGSQ